MLIGLPIVTLMLAAVVALAGTWLVLHNASGLGLVQAPNARSSHVRPTPSGGGVAIAAGGSSGALLISPEAAFTATALLLTSLAIAAIGWRDDVKHISPMVRLALQMVLLAIAIVFSVPLRGVAGELGLPLPDFMVFALVLLVSAYWLNLFNFMDGIDGLAATEALFLCLAPIVLVLAVRPELSDQPLLWWFAAIAAAISGFVVFNWPPARIFMGDAGSTYLGFMLALLAFATLSVGWLSVWQWLILIAAFVSDASLTLFRRLLRREQLSQAHREHAYQWLARRWQSHQRVTLTYAAINLAWLLPLAFLAQTLPAWAPAFALLAYAPLLLLAGLAGAGRPEHA